MDEIKNASIAQLNFSYIPAEDRLLLRVGMSNETELLVWITRRITLVMWQLLTQSSIIRERLAEAHTKEADKLKSSFAKETAAQQHNYNTPYEQRNVLNPNAIFLVQTASIDAGEHGIDHLVFECTNGQSMNIAMNDDLRFAIINMLQLVTKETDWGMHFSSQSAIINSPSGSHAVH